MSKFKAYLKDKLVSIIPLLRRESLLEQGRQSGTLVITQHSYTFDVLPPKNPDAKKRFGHLCGIKNVQPFFALIISDVRLIGPYGLPVTRNGKVIVEPMLEEWLPHVLKTTINELGFFKFLWQYLLCFFPYLDFQKSTLDFASHLVCRGAIWPGGPIFGHWMAEHLPQIRAIESLESRMSKKSKIIINRDPPDWQIESLELMGIEYNRLYIHSQKGLRVKKLVISSIRNVHSNNMEIDPIARTWASRRLQDGIRFRIKNENHQFEKISIFRQDARNRKLINIEEIKKIVESFGYYNFAHTQLSLVESGLVFQKTKDLIACFGSGITRIMFMETPKRLTEIYSNAQMERDVFFLFACEFGIEYSCIFADTVEDDSKLFITQNQNVENSHAFHQKNELWHLNINGLKELFREFEEGN
jgi:hypothetical protein